MVNVFRFFALSLLILSSSAHAAMALDAIQILNNIASQLGPWFYVVTAGAYIMGAGLFFRAIYVLKIYGQGMSMMSSQANLKEPLILLVVAITFLYLPSMLQVMLDTTFGEGSRILAYDEMRGATSGYAAKLGMRSLLYIVQFIGLVSFIRGLLIISKAANHGSQQNTMGKGFTHMVAGILGLNVIATWNILSATLGF
jgi:intracellular multiplication protein IcmC